MPLPRVRFTVRRMMIATAIVALTLGPTSWLSRRSARMKSIAHFHEQACFQAMTEGPGPTTETPRSRRHVELAIKYHQAARRPWLPVAPDPPEPE